MTSGRGGLSTIRGSSRAESTKTKVGYRDVADLILKEKGIYVQSREVFCTVIMIHWYLGPGSAISSGPL